MTAKIFLIIQGIICLAFGIALVFMPAYLGEMYITNQSWRTPASDLLGQAYGSILVAIGVVYFLARDIEPSTGRRYLVMITCLSGLFVIIIHAMAIFNKVENNAAWGTVGTGLFSLIAGGMVLMKEKAIEA